jgi:hypothetical protein
MLALMLLHLESRQHADGCLSWLHSRFIWDQTNQDRSSIASLSLLVLVAAILAT